MFLGMLFLVLFMGIVPVSTLIYLTVDRQEDPRPEKITLCIFAVGINLAVFGAVHYLLRGYVNFGATIYYLFTFHFSYQELFFFPVSFLACYIFSIVAGKMYCCIRRKPGKNIPYYFHSIAMLVVLGISYYGFTGKDQIILNEICGSNETYYLGEQYTDGYSDYVEICNRGIFANETDNLYLSEDKDNLKKLNIGGRRLEPGECEVIALDNSVSFQISGEGEWVYLSNDSGKVLDRVYSMPQAPDTAYTRMEPYGQVWKLMKCSPGIGNEFAEGPGYVKEPVLSVDSGFYPEPFYLNLSSDEGTEIYYTLDGSKPGGDSELYSEEIYVYDRSSERNQWHSVRNVVMEWRDYEINTDTVPKAFIVRAVAVDKEGNKSDVVTATYFIDRYYEGENVISLVADPEDLFGDDGICVTGKEYDEWYLSGAGGEAPAANFLKRGRASEIRASLELFYGQGILKQDVGIKVQGASSRKEPRKRFCVVARKEYCGSKWLGARLFGDYDVHSFALREGFANAFCPYLVEDREVATQRSMPAVVYLNGEYWYNTYMQERYTDEYFAARYGVDPKGISVVQEGILQGSVPEEDVLTSELYAFFEEHDMSCMEDYREFCDFVDIQSYIDFCCINLYLCNIDCDERKNCIMWKTDYYGRNKYEDQRYRWAIYDMDGLGWDFREHYGAGEKAEENNFAIAGPFTSGTLTRGKMFMALRENPEFVRQFVVSFMDIVNTDFTEKKVSGLLEEWGQDMSWNGFFFAKRREYALKYLAEELGLEGEPVNVCVNINDPQAGEIIINTMKPEFTENSWKGEYFMDYPLTLTAKAYDGYIFAGWSGDVVSEEEMVSFDMKGKENNIYAVFEKKD